MLHCLVSNSRQPPNGQGGSPRKPCATVALSDFRFTQALERAPSRGGVQLLHSAIAASPKPPKDRLALWLPVCDTVSQDGFRFTEAVRRGPGLRIPVCAPGAQNGYRIFSTRGSFGLTKSAVASLITPPPLRYGAPTHWLGRRNQRHSTARRIPMQDLENTARVRSR